MKHYNIELTFSAEQDILGIYNYIKNTDSVISAKKIFVGLEKKLASLKLNPDRGNYPGELSYLGIKTYREIHFHSYRIIYEILESKVFIHAIVDGRRDMLSFLEQRLLRI